MNAALVRAGVGVVLLALCAATPPPSGAEPLVRQLQQVEGVTFEADRTPRAHLALAACTQIVQLLAQHGWDARDARVRIQENPFDATSPAADVVLAAGQPGGDAAFLLAVALVERQTRRTVDPAVAHLLAQEVAAHLSPSDGNRRLRWEDAWQRRLSDGDVLSTALPELLWRTGGDAAIRSSARNDWPESAFEALAALGIEDLDRALGEVAVAGLLDPTVLGFHRPPAPDLAPAITGPEAKVRFDEAGMRIVSLADDVGAVGVLPLECEKAEAWVAVRYAVTGGFDVVPLSPRAEVTVPLRGAMWAGVIAVGSEPNARLSLAIRPVPDYPVQIKRWDFLASDRTVSLSWETQGTEGLRAFVVEALGRSDPASWSVVRRTVLPVGDPGESSCGYSFVDEEGGDVAAYRLLALTTDGFLAEMGSFPLRDNP